MTTATSKAIVDTVIPFVEMAAELSDRNELATNPERFKERRWIQFDILDEALRALDALASADANVATADRALNAARYARVIGTYSEADEFAHALTALNAARAE